MTEAEALDMKAALESKGEMELQVCTLGKSVVIKKNMVSIRMEKKTEHQRTFTPSVIEPSFGIGRIIYCLFEHCFYTRPSKSVNKQLNVFRFPPLLAPIKCTVLPLVKTDEFDETAKTISNSLTKAGISNIIDITGMVNEIRTEIMENTSLKSSTASYSAVKILNGTVQTIRIIHVRFS